MREIVVFMNNESIFVAVKFRVATEFFGINNGDTVRRTIMRCRVSCLIVFRRRAVERRKIVVARRPPIKFRR